jgi:plasmid stabilization system protein ParE
MIQTPLPLFKTGYFQNLLREAADFYNETAGYEVANRFLTAVGTALDRIADNPYSGSRYKPPEGFELLQNLHYRRLSLGGFSPFPYTIYYEIEQDKIVIQSIYHHARNRERLLSSELDEKSGKKS